MSSLLYHYILDPITSLFNENGVPAISDEENAMRNVWSSEHASEFTEIAIKALVGRSVTVLEYACNDVPFDFVQRKECERFVAREYDANTVGIKGKPRRHRYNGVHVPRMTEQILEECLSRPSIDEGALWFLVDGSFIRDAQEADRLIDKVTLLERMPSGVFSTLEMLGYAADGEVLVWTNPDFRLLEQVEREFLGENSDECRDIFEVSAKESKWMAA